MIECNVKDVTCCDEPTENFTQVCSFPQLN